MLELIESYARKGKTDHNEEDRHVNEFDDSIDDAQTGDVDSSNH